MVQYTAHPREIDIKTDLENVQGFIFSPFVENEQFPTHLLEPDIMFSGWKVNKSVISSLEIIEPFNDNPTLDKSIEKSTLKEHFVHSVNQIRWLISNSSLEKIVLSRVYFQENFTYSEIGAISRVLFDKYPAAFRYIINIPNEGLWLGASPEPLITIKDSITGLVSLAGTQKLNGVPVTRLKWNDKELNEQYIVSDYIEKLLQSNGISGYTSKGPVSYAAANVVHLQTQFTFPTKLVENKLGEFITSLHPTPSISGMPKAEALELIPNFESHQRRYYSGFLGPLNLKGESFLFVNLRCMRLKNSRIALYAGAGITEGSNAENEWEETNQKLLTMLALFNKE
jgi:isochorismate synthase